MTKHYHLHRKTLRHLLCPGPFLVNNHDGFLTRVLKSPLLFVNIALGVLLSEVVKVTASLYAMIRMMTELIYGLGKSLITAINYIAHGHKTTSQSRDHYKACLSWWQAMVWTISSILITPVLAMHQYSNYVFLGRWKGLTALGDDLALSAVVANVTNGVNVIGPAIEKAQHDKGAQAIYKMARLLLDEKAGFYADHEIDSLENVDAREMKNLINTVASSLAYAHITNEHNTKKTKDKKPVSALQALREWSEPRKSDSLVVKIRALNDTLQYIKPKVLDILDSKTCGEIDSKIQDLQKEAKIIEQMMFPTAYMQSSEDRIKSL